jgi:hypothetical protein
MFPSRLRNTIERLRNRLTGKQPYRCHDCGSRKWQLMAFSLPNPDISPDDLRTGQRPAPVSIGDLDPLDPADREIPAVSEHELDPLDPGRRN